MMRVSNEAGILARYIKERAAQSVEAELLLEVAAELGVTLPDLHATIRELVEIGELLVERIGLDEATQGALVRFHLRREAL